MFKKTFLITVVLVLALPVFSVRLIDPVSLVFSDNEDNFVGIVSPGGKLELIFSKELTNRYEDVELLTPLPSGFSYSTRSELESIKVFIFVPEYAISGDYPVEARIFGKNKEDLIHFYFTVDSSVVDVSPLDISLKETIVDSGAEYKIFFVNNSDAQATFTISTDLPPNWSQKDFFAKEPFLKQVTVAKRSSATDSIIIYPRLAGEKKFKVIVSYASGKKEFSFAVNTKPTLKSKLEMPKNALPFFSFSLLPSYFINALFSLIMN